MVSVKICGLTNLTDARLALEMGADLLGFICYAPSPRYVTPQQIAEIIHDLRPLMTGQRCVGVFVNADLATIADTMIQTDLDLAQLHGDESPMLLRALQGRSYKALRPTSLSQAQADAARYAHGGPSKGPDLLLDAYHPLHYGGTGHLGDWRVAADLARSYRILLAGGLTPANVTAAIAEIQPWGVDVSSGVEHSPGHKDHAALTAFMAAAKGMDPSPPASGGVING